MVSLSDVLASNAQISSTLPKRLVAVFAGATTGIGEATLKAFVKYAVEPRIYLFARNPTSAARVLAECRQLNSSAEYEFIKVDLSSVKETDVACGEIKRREKLVNLMVLSAGELILDWTRKLNPCCTVRVTLRQTTATSEGLNPLLAASTYTRIRIAQQLLPLLETAAHTTSLARVLDVAAGTKEGEVNTSDIASLHTPLHRLRPQLASMHTLAWEALAQQAPTVSFVHEFPDAVYTSLHKDVSSFLTLLFALAVEVIHALLGRWLFVPIEESGERHVFLATSGQYKPREGKASGVPLVKEKDCGTGSDGVVGSGTYSVDWDGEGPTKSSEIALKVLRQKGVREIVWGHFTTEFDRISSRGQST